MNKLSLKLRLLSTFTAVVVAFVGLATFLVLNMGSVEAAYDRALERDAHAAIAGHSADAGLWEMATLTRRYVDESRGSERPAMLAQYRDAEVVVTTALDAVTSVAEAGDAAWVASFEEAFAELTALWEQTMALADACDQEAARDLVGEGGPLLAGTGELLDGGIALIETHLAEVSLGATTTYERTRTTSILAALLLSVLGLAAAWWISRVTAGQVSASTYALNSSSEDLAAVAAQVGAAAEETSAQANVVAAAGEQVSHNVQTVATAVEEMSASVREIATSSSDASRVATAAVESVETTNQSVAKLGASSAEIGKVIEVITSIAEQTNLLALNATIEAARAGEAGKGFAVVANEVKELAKETAAATEEIGDRVASIQSDSQVAVGAIAEIGEVIGRIADMQNTIASAVEEQTATTNEIARNVNEAALGSAEIAENISSVALAAGETSQGAARTQEAAAQLREVAGGLQSLVDGAGPAQEARTGAAPVAVPAPVPA